MNQQQFEQYEREYERERERKEIEALIGKDEHKWHHIVLREYQDI